MGRGGSGFVLVDTHGTTSFLPFNALTMSFTSRSSFARFSLVALVDDNGDNIDPWEHWCYGLYLRECLHADPCFIIPSGMLVLCRVI